MAGSTLEASRRKRTQLLITISLVLAYLVVSRTICVVPAIAATRFILNG